MHIEVSAMTSPMANATMHSVESPIPLHPLAVSPSGRAAASRFVALDLCRHMFLVGRQVSETSYPGYHVGVRSTRLAPGWSENEPVHMVCVFAVAVSGGCWRGHGHYIDSRPSRSAPLCGIRRVNLVPRHGLQARLKIQAECFRPYNIHKRVLLRPTAASRLWVIECRRGCGSFSSTPFTNGLLSTIAYS